MIIAIPDFAVVPLLEDKTLKEANGEDEDAQEGNQLDDEREDRPEECFNRISS